MFVFHSECLTFEPFFCDYIFKDLNDTWYTVDPDFTPCFEQTVLVWIPCIFLLVFSSFDICYLRTSLDKNIPWNKLNISKVVLILSLLILTAVDIIMALIKRSDENTSVFIYPVDIWSPIIKFAAFVSTIF